MYVFICLCICLGILFFVRASVYVYLLVCAIVFMCLSTVYVCVRISVFACVCFPSGFDIRIFTIFTISSRYIQTFFPPTTS